MTQPTPEQLSTALAIIKERGIFKLDWVGFGQSESVCIRVKLYFVDDQTDRINGTIQGPHTYDSYKEMGLPMSLLTKVINFVAVNQSPHSEGSPTILCDHEYTIDPARLV